MNTRVLPGAVLGVLFAAGALSSAAVACDAYFGLVLPPPAMHIPVVHVSTKSPIIKPGSKRAVWYGSAPRKIQIIDQRPFSPGLGRAATAVDYAPFMNNLQNKIKHAWMPPKGFYFGPTMTSFAVLKNGKISNAKITWTSGDKAADATVLKALTTASPVSALPKGAPDYVKVQFTFESSDGKDCCCGGSQCHCTHPGCSKS